MKFTEELENKLAIILEGEGEWMYEHVWRKFLYEYRIVKNYSSSIYKEVLQNNGKKKFVKSF